MARSRKNQNRSRQQKKQNRSQRRSRSQRGRGLKCPEGKYAQEYKCVDKCSEDYIEFPGKNECVKNTRFNRMRISASKGWKKTKESSAKGWAATKAKTSEKKAQINQWNEKRKDQNALEKYYKCKYYVMNYEKQHGVPEDL